MKRRDHPDRLTLPPGAEVRELDSEEQRETSGGRCWLCLIGLPHDPFRDDDGGCDGDGLL